MPAVYRLNRISGAAVYRANQIADSTAPTMSGAISASAITQTSYTLSWSAGSDNIAVTGYEVSLDGGATWLNNFASTTRNVTGRTAGSTDQVRVRAFDDAGLRSSALSLPVTLLTPADTTVPVMTGSVTASSITQTSYTISGWGATDNVGVTGYELSLNGGTSYTGIGNVTTYNVTGRSAGATDQVRVRALDAAGNPSTALSAAVTLAAAVSGSITTPVLKLANKQVIPPLTGGWSVAVFNATTNVLVAVKTGLTSDAQSRLTFSDPSMSAGTSYAYEPMHATYGRRLPTGTAA